MHAKYVSAVLPYHQQFPKTTRITTTTTVRPYHTGTIFSVTSPTCGRKREINDDKLCKEIVGNVRVVSATKEKLL